MKRLILMGFLVLLLAVLLSLSPATVTSFLYDFSYPTVILQAGESISVHSGPEASGKLIWTRKYVWNNKGDKAILCDAAGNVVDVYGY